MSKDTTAAYLALDVRYLQRKGFLFPGASGTLQWSRNGEQTGSIQVSTTVDSVILSYRHCGYGEDWRAIEYPVRLQWTQCNYGGRRAWFLCPAQGCCRRVAILYGGGIFACRHCHQLVYESQHERWWDRALSQSQTIRVKLGGPDAALQPARPPPSTVFLGLRPVWCVPLQISCSKAHFTTQPRQPCLKT